MQQNKMRKALGIRVQDDGDAKGSGAAAEGKKHLAREGPRSIDVAVRVMAVASVSCAEQTFWADFVVVLQWHDPEVVGLGNTGMEWETQWAPRVVVQNGLELDSVSEESSRVIEDPETGLVRDTTRYRGMLIAPMTFHDFPFDRQELPIVLATEHPVENAGFDTPPPQHIRLLRGVRAQEWVLQAPKAEVTTSDVDPETRGQHSEVTVRIPARRLSSYYVWHVAVMVALLSTLSFVTFCFDMLDVGTRIGTTLMLLLTPSIFKLIIAESIPKIAYPTALDKYMFGSFTLMYVISIENGLAPFMPTTDTVDYAYELDHYFLIVSAGLWTLFNLYALYAMYAYEQKHQSVEAQDAKDRVEQLKRSRLNSFVSRVSVSRPKPSATVMSSARGSPEYSTSRQSAIPEDEVLRTPMDRSPERSVSRFSGDEKYDDHQHLPATIREDDETGDGSGAPATRAPPTLQRAGSSGDERPELSRASSTDSLVSRAGVLATPHAGLGIDKEGMDGKPPDLSRRGSYEHSVVSIADTTSGSGSGSDSGARTPLSRTGSSEPTSARPGLGGLSRPSSGESNPALSRAGSSALERGKLSRIGSVEPAVLMRPGTYSRPPSSIPGGAGARAGGGASGKLTRESTFDFAARAAEAAQAMDDFFDDSTATAVALPTAAIPLATLLAPPRAISFAGNGADSGEAFDYATTPSAAAQLPVLGKPKSGSGDRNPAHTQLQPHPQPQPQPHAHTHSHTHLHGHAPHISHQPHHAHHHHSSSHAHATISASLHAPAHHSHHHHSSHSSFSHSHHSHSHSHSHSHHSPHSTHSHADAHSHSAHHSASYHPHSHTSLAPAAHAYSDHLAPPRGAHPPGASASSSVEPATVTSIRIPLT